MKEESLLKALRTLAACSPGGPDQVAYVVHDIEASMKFWQALGHNEWLVYTYSNELIPNLAYKGQPNNSSFRLALSGRSPQMELIQPLSGKNLYTDWLKKHPAGVQHLGYFVPDLEMAVKPFIDAGVEIIQSGSGYGLDGDGGFAYFDLSHTEFNTILELIQTPKRRRPSEPITSKAGLA